MPFLHIELPNSEKMASILNECVGKWPRSYVPHASEYMSINCKIILERNVGNMLEKLKKRL